MEFWWRELNGLQSGQLLCDLLWNTKFIFMGINLWDAADVLFQKDQGENVAISTYG